MGAAAAPAAPTAPPAAATAAAANAAAAPAARQERVRRKHGLQPPLHPLQVAGWLAAAALAGGAFTALVPALPTQAQPTAAAAVSVLLLVHLAAHLAAALVDPAEAALRGRAPSAPPPLDRAKHAHAIEAGRCHLCRLDVSGPRTKHCGACNKCVSDFDHHCRWLNSCVGGRNYAPFLMCVSSAAAAAALVAALAVAALVCHRWGGADSAKPGVPPSNHTAPPMPPLPSSLPSGDATFGAIVVALGVLATVTAGLLLHLCFFHIYISFLGLTTYEYIRQQRQRRTRTPTAAEGRIGGGEEEEEEGGVAGDGVGGATLRHRPANLHCDERTNRTTYFTCTIMEETFSNNCNAEPTPTPPSTPQDCQMCVMSNNQVAPVPNTKTAQAAPAPTSKPRRKWTCCVSAPDSPDEIPGEPRRLAALCRRHTKTGTTHGHWSSAKLRMLFRVIGNLGHHRRRNSSTASINKNSQVVSSTVSEETLPTYTVPAAGENTTPYYPEVSRRANVLPALPTPPRRRLLSETELANALTLLQQQQRCGRRPPVYRTRRRRSVVHRPKTPALSPIRESGLSNPASPSRQNCAVAAISGSCTRPF